MTDAHDGDEGAKESTTGRRHDRLTRHQTRGRGNSLMRWTDAKSPLVVSRNYAAVLVARASPSLRLKNHLFRALGMTVGAGVPARVVSGGDEADEVDGEDERGEGDAAAR